MPRASAVEPIKRKVAAAALLALLSGCNGGARAPVQPPAVDGADSAAQSAAAGAACSALQGVTIAAADIGLPSGGATVRSANLQPAVGQQLNAAGAPLPQTPEFCRVLGQVLPLDPRAPPVQFQLNLPTAWSGRAMQFGGGGFNGRLVDATVAAPSAPPDAPLPLARGYATFGTDGGHGDAPDQPAQAFAVNDEALHNFGYAAYKKARDVAVALIRLRYGAPPRRTYYVGSAEGGREGLAMAQRFPHDYDGVYARAPSIGLIRQQIAGNASGRPLSGAGWLDALAVRRVHATVLAACDARDGLADGVVSRWRDCGAQIDLASLRCGVRTPGAQAVAGTLPGVVPATAPRDAGCLNDAQLAAVRALHAPSALGFRLADGTDAYPGWFWGGEQDPGGYAQWWSGTQAPAHPPTDAMGWQWVFGSGTVRHMVLRDPGADSRGFTPADHAERIGMLSALMDATAPDLSTFFGRGGRLLLLDFAADYARSPQVSIDYLQAVERDTGAAAAQRGMRLYVTPGADHDGLNVPSEIDMVAVLEAWVEQDRAPPEVMVQTTRNALPPYTVQASRPLCRFPGYPHYDGRGDPASAASFACRAH